MKGKKTLTTHEFADHFQVKYTTVMTWLKNGIVPGAKLVNAPRGAVWEIPVTVLETFKRPKMGRPKQKAKLGKTAKRAGKRDL